MRKKRTLFESDRRMKIFQSKNRKIFSKKENKRCGINKSIKDGTHSDTFNQIHTIRIILKEKLLENKFQKNDIIISENKNRRKKFWEQKRILFFPRIFLALFLKLLKYFLSLLFLNIFLFRFCTKFYNIVFAHKKNWYRFCTAIFFVPFTNFS